MYIRMHGASNLSNDAILDIQTAHEGQMPESVMEHLVERVGDITWEYVYQQYLELGRANVDQNFTRLRNERRMVQHGRYVVLLSVGAFWVWTYFYVSEEEITALFELYGNPEDPRGD